MIGRLNEAHNEEKQDEDGRVSKWFIAST